MSFVSLAQAKVVKSYSLSKLIESNKLTATERYWLNSSGPLNKDYGVTGASGPYGILGPYGDNLWNLTPWMNPHKSWEDFAEYLGTLGGPLSQYGPLFITTELGQAMASYDFGPDSGSILAAGGVLHSLGPSGLNGPMGIGGPLGPHGIHGYKRDSKGHYRNKNDKIVKKIKVKTLDGNKYFPLMEFYKEGVAKDLSKLDSSFVAQDKLSYSEEHTYKIKASGKRWINLTLIQAYTLDALKLELIDGNGKVLEKSDDSFRSNFISFKTSNSTHLYIRVSVKSSFQIYKKPYRLFVTEAPKSATESDSLSFLSNIK